jgi:diguanylate cyclase (GGDEF)-like protein
MAGSLVHGRVTVRDLIECDGVAVRLGGTSAETGDVPPADGLAALHSHVASRAIAEPFASSTLSLEDAALAAFVPSIAGVLMVLVGGAGDYVALFRNEILRKVNWLGDQTSANRSTPLSPRRSFSSWSDSVTGTAEPWGEGEGEAAELARDLEGALLRRAESELVHLAHHDPLTGLPNRRRLMEQLNLALRMESVESRLSLLFIDLDDFKKINDSYGHDVGDALITLVGQRISSATRIGDTVARLGGDEFVVLCRHTGSDEAEDIAARIRSSIAEPVTVRGATFAITASVGAAVTGRDTTASELLRRADVEMYSAKPSRTNVLR